MWIKAQNSSHTHQKRQNYLNDLEILKHNVLSFRTALHSFKTLGTTLASVHKTLMSPKLNSQFQTGNSCTGAGNGGYGCRSWDTIHNLVATGVAWTKERLPKKTVGHLQTPKILLSWSPFTDFLPTISRTVRFKAFFLSHVSVDVWPHPCFICVCAENNFDEISRRNSWPANTMTAVPKGTTTTKNIGSYENREHSEFFTWTTTGLQKKTPQKTESNNQATSENRSISHKAFSFWFVGPSMEHQHSNRVTEPAPRIVQGMNCC